jgi:hypothetical protein
MLETIVGRLEPPFRLAKFEGDAAFLFVEDGRADGSLLLDAIEAAYVAFRRRLRSIDQATSCDCRSCRLGPKLDLKFVRPHGAFVHARTAGRDEVAGSEGWSRTGAGRNDACRVARKPRPRPASRRTTTAMLDRSGSDLRGLRLTVAAFKQTLVKQTLCERWWSVGWRIERPRGRGANLIKQTLYERCRVGWVALEWPSHSGRWSI